MIISQLNIVYFQRQYFYFITHALQLFDSIFGVDGFINTIFFSIFHNNYYKIVVIAIF